MSKTFVQLCFFVLSTALAALAHADDSIPACQDIKKADAQIRQLQARYESIREERARLAGQIQTLNLSKSRSEQECSRGIAEKAQRAAQAQAEAVAKAKADADAKANPAKAKADAEAKAKAEAEALARMRAAAEAKAKAEAAEKARLAADPKAAALAACGAKGRLVWNEIQALVLKGRQLRLITPQELIEIEQLEKSRLSDWAKKNEGGLTLAECEDTLKLMEREKARVAQLAARPGPPQAQADAAAKALADAAAKAKADADAKAKSDAAAKAAATASKPAPAAGTPGQGFAGMRKCEGGKVCDVSGPWTGKYGNATKSVDIKGTGVADPLPNQAKDCYLN